MLLGFVSRYSRCLPSLPISPTSHFSLHFQPWKVSLPWYVLDVTRIMPEPLSRSGSYWCRWNFPRPAWTDWLGGAQCRSGEANIPTKRQRPRLAVMPRHFGGRRVDPWSQLKDRKLENSRIE
ncbi:hypothetical protein I7I50_09081 [Histoplasma capsulatum G186AR]|uniref:Uncharacterized protein n=1 Tax=Ajellomyces capsulatus TaxID=5037 RepID=A0A8H7YPF5_AJECA|nr:hypothetical protein I7I52_06600 [Histoplasma capsulatum]QSS74060.1 hypothetical protein I7I50_09081 [Histoplasma capsulatum G186AR]